MPANYATSANPEFLTFEGNSCLETARALWVLEAVGREARLCQIGAIPEGYTPKSWRAEKTDFTGAFSKPI